MKKILLLGVFFLLLKANTLHAFSLENASINFFPAENGFIISLDNIDTAQVSDCTWDGVSICDNLIKEIHSGNVVIEQSGSKVNITIPLTQAENGIFDNPPIFSLVFNNGTVLYSPVIFYSQTASQETLRFFAIIWRGATYVWKGGRWVLQRTGAAIWGVSTQSIIQSAKWIKTTKGNTKIYEKPGGYNQALRDFNKMKPSTVRHYPNGMKIGNKGSERVIVRPRSSDGRPTLEFQRSNGKKHAEIRYN